MLSGTGGSGPVGSGEWSEWIELSYVLTFLVLCSIGDYRSPVLLVSRSPCGEIIVLRGYTKLFFVTTDWSSSTVL